MISRAFASKNLFNADYTGTPKSAGSPINKSADQINHWLGIRLLVGQAVLQLLSARIFCGQM